jgi:hypothetical protein
MSIGRRSRSKGKRGENQVVHLIQPWWQLIEPGAEFASTPSSGGWRKSGSIRRDMRLAGDLTTNATFWPFTVEVKWREAWSPAGLVAGHRSPVWSWWRQAVEQAREEAGVPMLWFKRSRYPWTVMMPRHSAQGAAVCAAGCAPCMSWTYTQLGIREVEFSPIAWRASDLLQVHPSALMKETHR